MRNRRITKSSKQKRAGKLQRPPDHPHQPSPERRNPMLRQNGNTTRPNIGARFALGQTFITPGAQEALEISGETPIQFLHRHVSADWGDLSEEDVQENERSLREGFRLLSAYRTAKGQKIYVMWNKGSD